MPVEMGMPAMGAALGAAVAAEGAAVACLGLLLMVAYIEGIKIPEELLKDMRRWFDYET